MTANYTPKASVKPINVGEKNEGIETKVTLIMARKLETPQQAKIPGRGPFVSS